MKKKLIIITTILILSACNKPIRKFNRYLIADGTSKNTMLKQADSSTLYHMVRPKNEYEAVDFHLLFITNKMHNPSYEKSLRGVRNHYDMNTEVRQDEIDTFVTSLSREVQPMIKQLAKEHSHSQVFYTLTKVINEAFQSGADETDIYVCSDLANNTNTFSAYQNKDLKLLQDYERMSQFMQKHYPLKTNANALIRLHFLYAPEEEAQDILFNHTLIFLQKFYTALGLKVQTHSSFQFLNK